MKKRPIKSSDYAQSATIARTRQRARKDRMCETSRPDALAVTRRGLSADYAGDDPSSCNVPTKTGRPCRALALESGRCKKHGGIGDTPKVSRRNRLSRQRLIDRVDAMLARVPSLKERIAASSKA